MAQEAEEAHDLEVDEEEMEEEQLEKAMKRSMQEVGGVVEGSGAEMLRHKALGCPWHAPAFSEEVGMWRSHDKKQAKSAHNKGAVKRFIAIDPSANGTCTLIAKGANVQDPELVYGLQPKIVAVECLRLSKPRIVLEGCRADSCQSVATVQTPEGKDLWLRVDTGQTQYSSPFLLR